MPPLPSSPTLADIVTLDPGPGDTWFGHRPAEQPPRVFGGHVAAQAPGPPTATVSAEHHVHSLHGYFLRGGDIGVPIRFEVERVRDGRSFAARHLTVGQGNGAILVLSPSFHAGGPGGGDEPSILQGIPGPEHLPDTRFAKPGVREARDTSGDQPSTPQRRVWFRAGCGLEPHLHVAGVAHATGHGPFGAARRIVDTAGAGLFDPLFRASVDHAIRFHRRPRIDDRVVYDVDAVAHRDDRVLMSGRILDASGRRVATVAQEILVRSPEG